MQKSLIPLFLSVGLLIGGCTSSGGKPELPISYKSLTGQSVRPSRAELETKVVQEMEHFGEAGLFKNKRFIGPDSHTSYDIPITINAEVEQAIDYFTNKIPKRFSLYLARSTRYGPLMRNLLKQYNLPEDLIYLALIESGFSCQAVSRAAAVGPWQFIKSTAIRYGLRVNPWIDERQDPVKSTCAAARYLRDLHTEFGSWYLAAAGYNSGENKIRRALSLYHGNDYWSISHHPRSILAAETKEYVPKMIAAAIIAKEPARYGFIDIPYEPPLSFDEIVIHSGVSIGIVAKAAGLNITELNALNPELKRGITPPGNESYTLRVPIGTKPLIETAYAQLSLRERTGRFIPGIIIAEKGDTPQSVAKTHNVRLNDLLALNPRLQKNRAIRLGQEVLMPVAKTIDEVKVPSAINNTSIGAVMPWRRNSETILTTPHRNTRKLTHMITKGDTIWGIAQQYNINYKKLARVNRVKDGQLIQGQKLMLNVPLIKSEIKGEGKPYSTHINHQHSGDQIYRVQKGDTIWNISKRFNVSADNIKRWNKLNDINLSIGDTLKIEEVVEQRPLVGGIGIDKKRIKKSRL